MAREQRVLGAAIESSAVPTCSADNSEYRVGDDIFLLLDEVLNNRTRALLVYDDFSGHFTDSDVVALASVMRYNTSLLSVNLCGVDVGDSAISLLCDAMVRTRIRIIDLSNTYLADEAGTALVALARCNPNLRTVVVDDTLVSEEIMDEIDLACMNNDTMYELPAPPPIDRDAERYCVHNCFGACPNGEFCMLSHRSINLIDPNGRAGKQQGSGAALALPDAPAAGASWRGAGDDDDDDAGGPGTYRPLTRAELEQRRSAAAQRTARRRQRNETAAIAAVAVAASLCAAVVLVGALVVRRRQREG